MKRTYVCLSGIRNGALAAGELPDTLKILNWGENPSTKGPVKVGPATLSALQRQIAAKGYARIVIDFEHSSEPRNPKYQPPPRKHAGFGDVRIVEGDGIYLVNIEWTPSGREYAREYCDLSPTVEFGADGEVVFMKSVALVPNGAVNDLTFFAAEDGGDVEQPKENAMDYRSMLLARLNLPADATDAQIESAISGSGETQLAADVTELGKAVTALSAEVKTARETIATQAQTIGELQAGLARRDKNAVIERAAGEGKVVSLEASAIDKLTLAELETHVAGLKPTVPIRRQTPRGTPPAAGGGALSLVEQYNAIDDPAARAEFFAANRDKMCR